MTNLSRTIGVELEFIAPRSLSFNQVAERLTAAGVDAYNAGYTHAHSSRWKLVSDMSVTGNGNAMELVSPVLRTTEDLNTLRKACDTLVALGCTVNKTCGLHVHVGARGMTVNGMRKLAEIYDTYEQVIDSVMPSSRRAGNNVYCNKLNPDRIRLARASNASDIASAINGGSRYVKLNFHAFAKHGTVEFRHHAGTLQFTKVNEWVAVCTKLTNVAEAEANNTPAVSGAVAAAVAHARPRQAVLARLYDLIARPQGCTREEARLALGRRSPPNMQRLTEDANVQIVRRGERYYLAATATPATAPAITGQPEQPITLAGFCSKLALDPEQTKFWEERAKFFSEDTRPDRVGVNPNSLAYRRGLR